MGTGTSDERDDNEAKDLVRMSGGFLKQQRLVVRHYSQLGYTVRVSFARTGMVHWLISLYILCIVFLHYTGRVRYPDCT